MRVALFYFAVLASGIFLLFKDEKGLMQLFTAIKMYTKPFKIATFMYIGIMGMVLFPVNFIDLSLIGLYAVVYIFVGVVLFGIYRERPAYVLRRVSVLHALGVAVRLIIEWQPLIPLRVITILIYTAIVPLYLYIIQLFLTLKRFSSND